ncbi:MAG: NADH-quinone oxidoreductase subunit NuoE [Dehalococcoidia bacterium]|nr:NADH-quinone oxidoreductase subunit NuoE [Dehalococcoidia bacterium]MDH5781624.1 NADH-quinone oxidoreductase subunit NuoE [Dehalococcoidia bacterium]
MSTELAEILGSHKWEKGSLIPILQKVHEELGYLSKETLSEIAKRAGISDNEVFGVASFYTRFRFVPQGKHSVRVCLGTACHVRGATRIVEEVQRRLDIKAGQTTKDLKFSLERVNCLGCCALGPVIVVDKEYHGKVVPAKVEEILKKYD